MAEVSPRTRLGRYLRSNMTPPEVILWSLIRRDALGYRVRRQQPYGPYYLDFYIKKLNVAIEVDGNIHQCQIEHDAKRDKWLEGQGVTVIRIHARSILSSSSDVFDFLVARLTEISEMRRHH